MVTSHSFPNTAASNAGERPEGIAFVSFRAAAFAETQAARHSRSSALPSITAEGAMTALHSAFPFGAVCRFAAGPRWVLAMRVGHASPWPLTPPRPAPG